MTKIIHISDVHMCPPGGTVVTFDPAARLAATIRRINRDHADAALCVVSGDLADRGDEASYRRLRSLVAELRVPVRLMLGNHDARGPFRTVFPDAPVDEAGFVQAVADLGVVRVVTLDSLDEEMPSAGRLCERRLAWLSGVLAAEPEQATIVFLHHPPFPIGVEYFDPMLLEDGATLLDLLGRFPGVRHIAFGHVHLSVSGRRGRLSFSSTRGLAHPMDVALAGDTVQYVDRPPAYEILLVGGDDLMVHHAAVSESERVVASERIDPDGRTGTLTILDSGVQAAS